MTILKEIENTDFYNLFDELKKEEIKNKFYYVIKTSEILSKKYEVVTTNPPYMGSSMMNSKLSKYTKKNYPNSKMDMFAVFIEKCNSLTDRNGFCSMITMHGWMFLSSYERLREKMALIETLNMVHLGTRAFDEIGGEVVQTTVWIQRKNKINNFKGSYIRLVDFPGEENKRNKFLEIVRNKDKKYYFRTTKENFEKIPGMPIGYWASESLLKDFEKGIRTSELVEPRQGLATTDNDRFLRQWYEVEGEKINYNTKSINHTENNKFKFPTMKAILEKNKEKEIQKENCEQLRKKLKTQLEQKDLEINDLKRQLSESQNLANKYINAFKKSFFSRLFSGLSKKDIENDNKLIS